MKVKLIDLTRQNKGIEKGIIREIKNMFSNVSFIMGENVHEFEKEFAQYIGVKHAISVGNGTDALVIALKALGIKKNDEVITTAYSFFATAEAIAVIGAIPVFVDVKLDTYNIDENLIEEKITNKTRAILPVHLFGNPCNMKKINEIAKKHNLYVVEDACQAVGSTYDNAKIGSLSNIACFSFFPTKNLGCAGDGGMITTNDDKLATICKAFRSHGSGSDGKLAYEYLNGIDVPKEASQDDDATIKNNTVYNPMKYYNYLIGHNSRLDEIQAIILRAKFSKLKKWTEERKRIANYYDKKLEHTNLVLPEVEKNGKHVYHLYILQSDKRDSLTKYLKEKEIATGIYYQVPLHLQEAMLKYGYKVGDFPNAEYLSNRTFAIPLYVGMTKEEQDYVINCLKEYDKNGR